MKKKVGAGEGEETRPGPTTSGALELFNGGKPVPFGQMRVDAPLPPVLRNAALGSENLD